MLEKGHKVKCQISGFRGEIKGTKRYPNGTVHMLVEPDEGEAKWFGELQLERTDLPAVKAVPAVDAKAPKKVFPKGPTRKPRGSQTPPKT